MKVFCTHAIRQPLDEAVLINFDGPLEFLFDSTVNLLRRVANGDPFDVFIGVTGSYGSLDHLVDTRHSRVLARAGIGLAVPENVATPDISNLREFTNVLSNASSVAYSRAGASGVYFAQLLEHLGLADEVNATATILETGLVAETLCDGRADVAVQLLSELNAVPGAQIAGPFPSEIQQYTEFSAVPALRSVLDPESMAFLEFLTSDPARLAYSNALLEV